MRLGFRRWFLNESPDKLNLNDTSVLWTSGITFFLFSNYALYANGKGSTHHQILGNLYDIQINRYPASRISIDNLNKIIESEGSLLSHGKMNQAALEEMINVLQIFRDDHGFGSYRNNHHEIEGAPNILLGRVWPELKAISFWNRSQYVFPKSNQILDFIKVFGNPTEYQYEINNEIINYEDFVKRKAA
jgi:hypothetical protein